MKLVWKVKYIKGYGACLWLSFNEAWVDFKESGLGKYLYPTLVNNKYYNGLKEYHGP